MNRAQALTLLGAAGATVLPRAVAAQTPTVRIATSPADSYGEPFFAVDGGFFARAGINAELTMLPNGGAIAAAIAGNAIDVGVADPINIANATIHGVPLAILAGGGQYATTAPTTLLLVPRESSLRRPKDLEGQTIGVVALASISSLALREWLRTSAVDSAKVSLIEMPFPDMVPAMQRGRIAAALMSEPFIADSKTETRVFGKPFDAIAPTFYISTVFAGQSWISKNPDLAKRVVRTIYETARWSNAHHTDTARILVKYTKLDLARVESMTRVIFATSLDLREIQPMLEVAYRQNQLQRPVKAADLVARI